jgi:transposase
VRSEVYVELSSVYEAFEVEAESLVTRQGLSFAEADRRLGIGQNLLRKWRDQFAAEGSKAFAAKA